MVFLAFFSTMWIITPFLLGFIEYRNKKNNALVIMLYIMASFRRILRTTIQSSAGRKE
jgi:hypothetical protein